MDFTARERQEGSKVERIALGIREELYGIDPNINVSITRILDENKRLLGENTLLLEENKLLKERPGQQKGGLTTDDLENIANTVESVLKKYVG